MRRLVTRPTMPARLGWDPPGDDARWPIAGWPSSIARRVARDADRERAGRRGVGRGRVARHPQRFVGAFMFNPHAPDADARLERAFAELQSATVCLFPAMHHVRVDDPRSSACSPPPSVTPRRCSSTAACCRSACARSSVCRAGSICGLGDPLAVAAVAVRHPQVPVIIPHFGAGLFREALMAADAAPNIRLDTSSSNSWIKFLPGLTLADVFARALDCVGPERLLFGTDSSFFPRGWQKAVYDAQREWTGTRTGSDPFPQSSASRCQRSPGDLWHLQGQNCGKRVRPRPRPRPQTPSVTLSRCDCVLSSS